MSDGAVRETELKIPVTDLEAVRRRLEAAAATCLQTAVEELNVVHDDAAGSLLGSGRTLRLRRYAGRMVVTFKGPTEYHGPVKSREEIELAVADLDALATIFARIGLPPVVRYEKVREEWRLDRLLVTLDHTPMGDFVELEGPEEELAAAAVGLGLDPDQAARGSYLSLWQRYRADHPELDLPFDMVFHRR